AQNEVTKVSPNSRNRLDLHSLAGISKERALVSSAPEDCSESAGLTENGEQSTVLECHEPECAPLHRRHRGSGFAGPTGWGAAPHLPPADKVRLLPAGRRGRVAPQGQSARDHGHHV